MEKEAEEKAVTEVKLELQRVKILIEKTLQNEEEEMDDEELEMWLVDSAIHTILALKELKEMRSDGGLRMLRDLGFLLPSKEFICPISGRVMEDPVLASCGLSYERRCIEKWVSDGNNKWPGSDQEVGDVSLNPNNLIKKQILQWCENPFFKDKNLLTGKFYGLSRNQDDKPPQALLCPISGNLMENPLIAASGQTFEEACIAKWVKDGNTKCPKTDQLLSHTLLIPNLSIKAIIHKWRSRDTSAQADKGEDGGGSSKPDRDHLIATLEKLPSLTTPSDMLPLLKDLRLLTARLPSFRAVFYDLDGAARQLLNPNLINIYKSDAALYNEVVATLMNISIQELNKFKLVQDCPCLIPFLTDALKYLVSIETSGYAAAALCQLSSNDSNSLVIGNCTVFQLLGSILDLEHPTASREAASAIIRLCYRFENRDNMYIPGGPYSLIKMLDNPALVDVIVEILRFISGDSKTIDVIVVQGGLPRLLRIMEETKSLWEEENCVAVIYNVAQRWPEEVARVEDGLRILSQVANHGSVRSKIRANQIVSLIKGKAPIVEEIEEDHIGSSYMFA